LDALVTPPTAHEALLRLSEAEILVERPLSRRKKGRPRRVFCRNRSDRSTQRSASRVMLRFDSHTQGPTSHQESSHPTAPGSTARSASGRVSKNATGFGDSSGCQLCHRLPEGVSGESMEDVEVDHTLGGDPVRFWSQFELRDESPWCPRQSGHDYRSDAIGNGIACEHEHGPIAAKGLGEPDLTPFHRASPTNLRPAPNRRHRPRSFPQTSGGLPTMPPLRVLPVVESDIDEAPRAGVRICRRLIARPNGSPPPPHSSPPEN